MTGKISEMTLATSLANADLLELSQVGPLTRSTALSTLKAFLTNGALVQQQMQAAASDETTALTASTSVTRLSFRAPASYTGLSFDAGLVTAQASGATLVTLDVKKNGTSMFSTLPTFNNTSKTTIGATTPAVLSSTTWAKDDLIEVYVTALQSGSVAAGLKINFTGFLAGGVVVSGVPYLLATVTGINAKTVARTALYTVPTGRQALIMAAVVRCTAASAITAGPSVELGVSAGDIYANTATGLLAAAKAYTLTGPGLQSIAQAAQVISFGVGTAATGTSQTLAVDLMGYLI